MNEDYKNPQDSCTHVALLWLSGLSSLGLLIYALGILPPFFNTPPGNLLFPSSSNYDVYPAPNNDMFDSRTDYPAVPLYLAPNGKQQGMITWWEDIDSSKARDGYIQLDPSAASTTVTRYGKEVGNWVRLSDLSFDLRDVARHAGRPDEAQHSLSYVEIDDLNGDGVPECLEVSYETSPWGSGYVWTIYGTPEGKPVSYLNLSVLSHTYIDKVKLANGTCAIVSNGLIWNNLAYRWSSGQFRRCFTPLAARKATLHRRFWWQVLASFFSVSLLLIVLPVIWICCLPEPWHYSSFARTAWMQIKLWALFAVLVMLAWRVYRNFGFEDGAPWRFSMFGCAACALAVILLIPIIRTWGVKLAGNPRCARKN